MGTLMKDADNMMIEEKEENSIKDETFLKNYEIIVSNKNTSQVIEEKDIDKRYCTSNLLFAPYDDPLLCLKIFRRSLLQLGHVVFHGGYLKVDSILTPLPLHIERESAIKETFSEEEKKLVENEQIEDLSENELNDFTHSLATMAYINSHKNLHSYITSKYSMGKYSRKGPSTAPIFYGMWREMVNAMTTIYECVQLFILLEISIDSDRYFSSLYQQEWSDYCALTRQPSFPMLFARFYALNKEIAVFENQKVFT